MHGCAAKIEARSSDLKSLDGGAAETALTFRPIAPATLYEPVKLLREIKIRPGQRPVKKDSVGVPKGKECCGISYRFGFV